MTQHGTAKCSYWSMSLPAAFIDPALSWDWPMGWELMSIETN